MNKEGTVGESLASRIADLRRDRGWSQKELARRVGMKPTQISKYERGIYEPRVDVVIRLAAALEVSTDLLLTGREHPESREDFRFRERLVRIDELPKPQRDNLVQFLDALIEGHHRVRRYQEKTLEGSAREKKPRNRTRATTR
jgi:transcriptional regulator with XRE-family HTH domain